MKTLKKQTIPEWIVTDDRQGGFIEYFVGDKINNLKTSTNQRNDIKEVVELIIKDEGEKIWVDSSRELLIGAIYASLQKDGDIYQNLKDIISLDIANFFKSLQYIIGTEKAKDYLNGYEIKHQPVNIYTNFKNVTGILK